MSKSKLNSRFKNAGFQQPRVLSLKMTLDKTNLTSSSHSYAFKPLVPDENSLSGFQYVYDL